MSTSRTAPRELSAGDYGTAAACALAALAVYFRTLPPTVTGEDSGELVVAAYTLGIPHPSGYPLWCLLAHLFTYLPIGSIAWRVTLASAVFAAASVFVVGLIVAWLTRSRAAVVAGALGFAFSRELWEQASIAEVYSLNALLTSVCLLLLLRWYAERRSGLLYAFAVVYGFGLANHQTMLVLGVAFVAFVVSVDRSTRAWRRVYPRCVLLAVLPLAVYAYLPIRSAADPPIDWGDPETWSRFWDVVSRRQYAYLWTRYPRDLGRFVGLVGEFLRQYGMQFTLALAPLPVVGAMALWRRDRRVAVFLGGLFLYIGLAFVVITNFDIESRWEQIQFGLFWLPAYLVAAILLGVGTAWLAERAPRGWAVGVVLAVMVPTVVLLRHFRAADKSAYWFADDFGRNVLATPEAGALLFARGDHTTFPALYLQIVDGIRPDVVIADKYGYPEPSLYADMPDDVRRRVAGSRQATEHWIFAHTDRPIYTAEQRPIPEEIGTLEPAGLLYRLVRRGASWQPPSDLWDRYTWHTLDPSETHGNWSAEAILTDTYYALGRHRLATGDVAGALVAFDQLLAAAGENVVDLTNLGASCVERGRWIEGIAFLDRALRLDPRYVPALKNLVIAWAAQGDCRRALPALDELVRLGAANPDEQALRRACREQLAAR